jgi:SAM-dependent methyltransferase
MNSAWWTTYFDESFLRIYEPLLAERTPREIEAITELLAGSSSRKVLDVACGWGRHSLALAAAGFEVTGLDLSPTLLDEARRRAVGQRLNFRFVAGDMRELPFEAEFDAALSLFSSLGYFEDERDDQRVLEGMRAAVRDGGVLILETMHRDLIAREYAERDWWITPTGERVWVEREFDSVAGVSHETLRWRASNGTEGEKEHHIRVRCASEWKELLREAGWLPGEWFGSWDLEPFALASERLIVVATAR